MMESYVQKQWLFKTTRGWQSTQGFLQGRKKKQCCSHRKCPKVDSGKEGWPRAYLHLCRFLASLPSQAVLNCVLISNALLLTLGSLSRVESFQTWPNPCTLSQPSFIQHNASVQRPIPWGLPHPQLCDVTLRWTVSYLTIGLLQVTMQQPKEWRSGLQRGVLDSPDKYIPL